MTRSTTAVGACLSLWAFAAGAGIEELDQHRAVWTAAGLEDYVYAYQKYCECNRDSPPATVVTVRAGRVARVHHEHADSARDVPAREGSLELYWTLDDLFALAANALEAGADVRVRYDAELGYPLELYVDYDAELVGDELDLRVTRFDAGAR